MDDRNRSRPTTAPCRRIRLAESEVASVDLCECGMMHLHLGPLSLRLTPDALQGVLGTLAEAVATKFARSAAAPIGLALQSARRGEA